MEKKCQLIQQISVLEVLIPLRIGLFQRLLPSA